MPLLHEVIALAKGAKKRTNELGSELLAQAAKKDLYEGLTGLYTPLQEGGLTHEPQVKVIQLQAEGILGQVAVLVTDAMDWEATREWGNQQARADVVVEGDVLLEGVPVTFLLSLETQLSELAGRLKNMPVLDGSQEWELDPNTGLRRTRPSKTYSTEKVSDFRVVVPPTDRHPAHVETVTRDVHVGYWERTRHSGAFPAARRQEILARIETLLRAVKSARARANAMEVQKKVVGAEVFGYLFEK